MKVLKDKVNMVKRNNYSQEYKNKVAAEICGGTSAAVISKREHVSVQTLNNWKAKYLSGEDVDQLSQSAVTDMRKKLSELSVLYAEAMLEIQILKKTEKVLKTHKRKESSSGAISPQTLALKKAVRR
ncbi:transposase [Leptospira noguchii]|uniref:Transposase n=1 Tax=Leptospira noguchii str. 2001034031 TaxID=1193053 RepID=M6Y7V3_9LEPT|nr:transposase [Leptospira noguchii]EMO89825.1 transposase [Leptospira noguchii str. 2001034031]